MKIKVSLLFFAITTIAFSQTKTSFWKSTTKSNASIIVENKKELTKQVLFELDIANLQQTLSKAPKRIKTNQSDLIITIPNNDGVLENFRMYESSNMDPELAKKYPTIQSYVGQSLDNKRATIYCSLSPLGFQSMVLNVDRSATFIEPYTTDLKTYAVYKKSDKTASLTKFECRLIQNAQTDIRNTIAARPNADDGILRTYRLALSVTAEYTTYFGGTIPLAMAAMNNTMTRINGVFEMDFNVHMNLIANNDILIYTNAATDPYSIASTGAAGAWNTELQNNLTNTIGNAAYDIGHLFGASGGGGNAGCIGCVCVDDTVSTTDENKGSGYTSPNNGIPSGDTFDIDYVAHEMGHQFGGNHTFTHSNESGTGAQMEPGSGSTIMGYAGITTKDVQPHSDAYFHAISIQQITNYIKTTTCQTNTTTGNTIPTVNAGLDYTIPKSTPFMLTGSGSDANGDVLTYCWEQMNTGTSTTTTPNATKTSGPNFRSYNPTTSPIRYFPNLNSVLAGATTTAGTEITVEALPSVARTFNFRLTARDNHLGGPANNSDDSIITVNATAGPFLVTSPNTVVSFTGNNSQTITWDVAGTTANGVNCANVDILLSTDGGVTFPNSLVSGTPNDGTQSVIIPNIPGTTNRIMIKGTNHIFFDISNTNFTIINGIPDTIPPSATVLSASNTSGNTTSLSWTIATDNIGVTSYDVYKNGVLLINTTATSLNVTGLAPSTAYTFIVKAKDAAGNQSVASNSVTINTLAPDVISPTPPTLSASGTTSTTTLLSWAGATDNYGVAGYDVYQGASLLGSTSLTTYTVSSLNAFSTYTFYVRAKDAANNISIASNIVTVTTLPGIYCTSMGNSVVDELIGNVQFGTINNTSTGGTGYTNFTSISTDVTLGTSQTITITPTWIGTIYNEGYAVFIDYNRDGDFDDSGETVWTKTPSKTTPVSGTFTIPTTAIPGPTRMRVSLRYNAIPTACLTYDFGQVEDYTIILKTVPTETILNLKLYMEGYYDTSTHAMKSVKVNQGVGVSTTNVDDITVELRNAATYSLVASTNTLLKTDGTATCTFNSNYSGSYYIAVKHRSAVQTWSALPITLSTLPTSYDFTTNISKAYGANMTQLESGIWGFYAGDINQDEAIDNSDSGDLFIDIENSNFGYLATDLNGDGAIDNSDTDHFFSNVENSIYSNHP